MVGWALGLTLALDRSGKWVGHGKDINMVCHESNYYWSISMRIFRHKFSMKYKLFFRSIICLFLKKILLIIICMLGLL